MNLFNTLLSDSKAFVPLNISVVTVSDRHTEDSDASGRLLGQLLTEAGHHCVERRIVQPQLPNLIDLLRQYIADPGVDVVLLNGGTGLTHKDITPEALAAVQDREITGFGELFRYLSYARIGTATLQSRATAAVAGRTCLFALPGSSSACREAWDDILRWQLDSRTQPCNLAELLPRLQRS